MAAVDAYAPCPCGSDEKFKWCCQKAESYIDRAERLDRNGQHEAALGVVIDGLSKHPDVPWLLLRKSLQLMSLGRTAEALATVGEVLRKRPDHFGAVFLNFRLLMESGDLAGAVAQFQSAFARCAGDAPSKARFASLAAMLATATTRLGLAASALKHLELAQRIADPEDRYWLETTIPRTRAEPSASAWVKNPYALAAPPPGLGDDARKRFEEAVAWSDQGLWAQAASAFELLSGDAAASAAAERNLGLCRLWLGESAAAAEAIRRGLNASGSAKPTTDEVDLEALCQSIDDRPGDDPVEEVELSWPIRDRAGLLERLENDPRCIAGPEESGEGEGEGGARPTESFLLLDRPKLAQARPDLKPTDLPLVVGRIAVGPDSVVLATRDDGRLNATIDGFAAAAEQTIPPAQPRTKVVGTTSRADLVLDVVCYPPADLPSSERERLTSALLRHQLETLWPETPMPYLGGKSPASAAKAGGFERPLRAAFLLMEETGRNGNEPGGLSALRSRLGVPAEPPIDHSSVKIEELHLGRLALLDPKRLDDDRLAALYQRSREWGQPSVVVKAAREITTRPRLLARDGFPLHGVYSELALTEAAEGRGEAAREWVRKGRGVDPRAQARHPVALASWDMLDLQIQMAVEKPETWVPELVAVMARYERDRTATQLILTRLVQAGLIQLVPSGDQPDGFAVDSSVLQHLISRYGPRVQTATGEVGVSASGGGIWTPGAPSGGGGGIWTPGSGAGAGSSSAPAEKPRIILPGQ